MDYDERDSCKRVALSRVTFALRGRTMRGGEVTADATEKANVGSSSSSSSERVVLVLSLELFLRYLQYCDRTNAKQSASGTPSQVTGAVWVEFRSALGL
jgi:hypothetical protein